ncbi:MAG: 1-acyl-sn-glycerol-3-phosphate acyltransferase [Bacteroidales bacterium]|nr:1-acyl-sn-glycerol-3-phosphate acyltransferase [Bacteroidales bacterium]
MALLDIKELEGFSGVFRGKAGNAFGRMLMHWLSVDKMNELYARHEDVSGPDFARDVLADIGMKVQIGFADGAFVEDVPYGGGAAVPDGAACGISEGESALEMLDRLLPQGPFITISNHPCGHVDGIALVDIFGHLRPGYKVMVNKVLSRIEALGPNFITVTPTGNERSAPTAASIAGVKAALAQLRSGRALGLFPSGAVSDLCLKERRVRDREWQEAVVRLIAKARVPIVPVRFFDGNSPFYYSLGLIDWRVRLLRLPSEVFNKADRPMRVGIGPLLSVALQDSVLESARKNSSCDGDSDALSAFRDFLRSSVYDIHVPEFKDLFCF